MKENNIQTMNRASSFIIIQCITSHLLALKQKVLSFKTQNNSVYIFGGSLMLALKLLETIKM